MVDSAKLGNHRRRRPEWLAPLITPVLVLLAGVLVIFLTGRGTAHRVACRWR